MGKSTEIVGTWFPTGYHGHFRSKSRPDFLCEYRQLAKPQPPDRFLKRSMQPMAKHVFSYHNNREIFLNDATLFEQGLGKRRNSRSLTEYKPDFVTWMPLREEVERSRPLVSTYRLDYDQHPKRQLWVKRPVTSFETQPGITTYRYAHGAAAPNREEIRGQVSPALSLAAHQRREMGLKNASRPTRDTVASCLSWYRPRLPEATPTTNFCAPTPTQSQTSAAPSQPREAWQAPCAPPPQPAPCTAPPTMQHVPCPPSAPPPPPQPTSQPAE